MYHIITVISASRENSRALNSGTSKVGYTQNQDKSAITLFNRFLVVVLGLVSINELKIDDLKDDVEKILMGYSLYIRDTNIQKNHQACLADNKKYFMGYLKFISFTEYLIKDINLFPTKNSGGRGSEGKYLNIKNFKYDIFCDCLDTLYIDMMTLMQYLFPFVQNKKGYATCIFHALGCYVSCG